jgi:hypothetical protein
MKTLIIVLVIGIVGIAIVLIVKAVFNKIETDIGKIFDSDDLLVDEDLDAQIYDQLRNH